MPCMQNIFFPQKCVKRSRKQCQRDFEICENALMNNDNRQIATCFKNNLFRPRFESSVSVFAKTNFFLAVDTNGENRGGNNRGAALKV